ncbi:hypothetical protein EON62_01495 [archaeon]|nr:MAG: hypothetical protein EON62_01495 [archaeon]
MFTPDSPHIRLSLEGVDIIANGSGSHTQLRKLNTRVDLMHAATGKCGGVYMYANQQGCDGGRLYYDGCAMVVANGKCLAQGAQFSVRDVEVVTAVVDLNEGRSYRAAIASRSKQASDTLLGTRLARVDCPLRLGAGPDAVPTLAREVTYLRPEEEIGRGTACWLWDFLRRSGASGFFLPLSGGADSAATATCVGIMCHLLMDDVRAGYEPTLADVRRVTGLGDAYVPSSAQELAHHVMHTAYLGTENSSAETRDRAAAIAAAVGAYHMSFAIDAAVKAFMLIFALAFGATAEQPRFQAHGGTRGTDLALQNLQARLRMVVSYFLAQLLPWIRRKRGFLLVLGSANVDEALRGYMTKYDCSSADINPIGGICKRDLAAFLRFASTEYAYPVLLDVVHAAPTAELQPATVDAATGAVVTQLDEVDMGMTYDELRVFGHLRKIERCGPYTMFVKCCTIWTHLTPDAVATKVKRFFTFYSINRHKLTTLTPSYHAESYSPDDNRFDLRPFLYNTTWDRQFRDIDAEVSRRFAVALARAER